MPEAPPRAAAIGATAMQIFTKMANRWAERDCESEECAAFRAALAETRVTATMAHDSYLINLASPDPVLRARSIESFVAELRRCDALGLDSSCRTPATSWTIARVGHRAQRGLRSARRWRSVPGGTMLCLETTAGTGTSLGATFEELAALIGRIDAKRTATAWASASTRATSTRRATIS